MSRFENGGGRKPYDRPRPRVGDGFWKHDRAPGVPASVVNTTTSGNANIASVNTKLVVSNLHYNVTPKDLIAIFGQIGTLVREPHIRYDRSGRSTGVAYITYETPIEATRAKKQFDGILAKGQPMSVAFDTALPPRAPRRASAPGSLMDRIQKPGLLERLASDAEVPGKDRRAAAPERSASIGVGPDRTRSRRRGGAAGAGPGRRFIKKAKTAEELDKELDAYLRDDTPGEAGAPAPAEGQTSNADADVEMV